MVSSSLRDHMHGVVNGECLTVSFEILLVLRQLSVLKATDRGIDFMTFERLFGG